MQSLLPSVNGDTNKKLKEEAQEVNLSLKPDEAKCSQPFDSSCTRNSTVKNGRTAKNGHKRDHSSYLDLSVSAPQNLSDVISPTSMASSCLLPVLGLCAPNARQRHSTSRTFRTPASKQASHHEKKRSVFSLPEFLSPPPELSAGPFTDPSSREALTDPSTLPETPKEASNPRSKNIIPDNYFPFSSVCIFISFQFHASSYILLLSTL